MKLRERTQGQWREVLLACGVHPREAVQHAEAFSQVLRGNALSRGEDELDDFLGQILHESGMLTRLRENMNYSAGRIRQIAAGFGPGTRWHAAGEKADWLEDGGPERIANFLYCDRMGNGPFESGDGWFFRGGTHLMCTGRGMYERMSDLVGQDLTVNPHLVEQPIYALEISVACWEDKVPDICLNDLVRVTKRINGGVIGIKHRETCTLAATRALALA